MKLKSPVLSSIVLLIGLMVSSWIAYAWPVSWEIRWTEKLQTEQGGFLPALWQHRLFLLVALTMFCVGTLLTRQEVKDVLLRWPWVLAGTGLQYAVMPLLAWMVAQWSGLEGDDRLGILMVGCVPGAMASNVLTLAARGNTSYSVSLTTSATLVSPLVVPLIIQGVMGKSVPEGFAQRTFWNLLLQVVLPVTAGFAVRCTVPRGERFFQRAGPLVANLAILLIIALVVALNRERLQTASWLVLSGLLGPLLILNLCGYLGGYLGGVGLRLPAGMRRALTLEVGMQNAGLGTALAHNLFGAGATIAPAIYTFGCMLTGTLLACFWSSRPIPNPGAEHES